MGAAMDLVRELSWWIAFLDVEVEREEHGIAIC